MWTQVGSVMIFLTNIINGDLCWVPSPHPEQDNARLQGQHQPPPQVDLYHAEGSLREGAASNEGQRTSLCIKYLRNVKSLKYFCFIDADKRFTDS